MCVVECLGHVGYKRSQFTKRKASGVDDTSQGHAVDKVGNEGRHAVHDGHFVKADNPWMAKLGRCPRLALEALDEDGRREHVRMRDLDRDGAVQMGISGAPHRSEAALADAFEELKAAPHANFTSVGYRTVVLHAERATAFAAKKLLACLAVERKGLKTLRARKYETGL
jgi:hypothetical protein